MSAGRARGSEEGGKGSRFYKVVGALVVALVVAVVVLPLWFGGGQPDQGRVVEVQPRGGDAGGGEGSGSGEEDGPSGGDAAPQPLEEGEQAAEGEGGQEKWWRTAEEGSESSSDDQPVAALEQVLPDQEDGASEDDRSQAQAPGEAESESADRSEPAEPEAAADPEEETDAREDGEAGSKAPGVPDGPFWGVMVGSFQDPDNAEGLRDRLRDEGYEVSVVPTEVDGRQWHRVIVGSGETREAAQDLVPSLEETGFENLLVIEIEEGPASS